MTVHENLLIHVTEDQFYVQPIAKSDEVLSISKETNECRFVNANLIPEASSKIYSNGLLGSINLATINYLLILTSKEKVGNLIGNDVWKALKIELIPYKSDIDLNETDKKINLFYKSMLENILKTQNFYLSYTYDLTRSMQKINNMSPDHFGTPLFERSSHKFVWNNFLVKNLNPKKEFLNYFVPLIHGFVAINSIRIRENIFDFILLSRRSCLNAGTRFNVRGADENANVANFVETEQIVLFNDFKCSYTQVRGSIPIFWTQKANLKYKPSMMIDETKNHHEVCQKHFDKISKHYENQVVINLINQHGSEGNLEKAFSNAITLMNKASLRYEYFDFHKQCGNDKWDRLSILINRLANDQDQFGFFCVNKSGNVLNTQKGIFRTNCIDCLDRTNVVQSLLAKRIMHIQLIKINLIRESESFESNKELFETFRKTWADNGDILSIQYAGTGALKSDFTRTGKRTTFGMIKDGINSLHRYFLNNFHDGYRQDSIDLLLGNYTLVGDENIPTEKVLSLSVDKKLLIFPIIAAATFSMFVLSLFIEAETFQEQLTYILFWSFSFICSIAGIIYNGNEFVNKPFFSKYKNKKE